MNTLIPVFSAPALDGGNAARHNPPVAFNRATGFSSPETTRQTSRLIPISGGVVTSASPLLCLFQWETGAGGLVPAGNVLSSLLTRLLFPAITFSSVKRVLATDTKR